VNFFKILDKLKIKNSSLILYCLLDRIPIVVFGEKSNKINQFLIELSELIHFRKEIVFYTDFISIKEYENLISNEEMDYNSQRVLIRCPCNVAIKALNQFNNFNSWLIGFIIPENKKEFHYLMNLIRKKIGIFLLILITSNTISIELEGINIKLIDLTLEQNILQKISQDTVKSINRMKRVLSEKIKANKMDKELINTLLDFELEKKELKKNILKKEIQNFYFGSKRAFFILSRLNLLNNLEFKTRIGSKALLETIDFEEVQIQRIISFTNKEWGEDFSNLIENNKNTFMGDRIQSLWG